MRSGLIRISGGIMIVTALVFLFGFAQPQAQGITFSTYGAPVELPVAWVTFTHNHAHFEVAILVGVGFFPGGFLRARWAPDLSNVALEHIFGVAMLVIALKVLLAA